MHLVSFFLLLSKSSKSAFKQLSDDELDVTNMRWLILDNPQNLMYSYSMYVRQCKIKVCQDIQDGGSVIINRHENTPGTLHCIKKGVFC